MSCGSCNIAHKPDRSLKRHFSFTLMIYQLLPGHWSVLLRLTNYERCTFVLLEVCCVKFAMNNALKYKYQVTFLYHQEISTHQLKFCCRVHKTD